MKIIDVFIENYRQYKGPNPIHLSVDPVRNITIIQAFNGSGKSNFMNAITWCLYDEEMFKSKNNEGRPVVNESALFESDGKPVNASVTVIMGNSEPQYEFKRTYTFCLEKNRPYVDNKTFTCRSIGDNGWVRRDNPTWLVDSVFIKSALKSFFFFDGEKMDRYFEDTSKIKTNVEQIAQIDLLDETLNTLKEVKSSILKDKKAVNKNPVNFDQDPDDINNEIYQLTERKKAIEDERKGVEDEISTIDEYLSKNSDDTVSSLQSERDTKEKLKTNYGNQLVDNKKNFRDLISSSVPIVFAYKALTYSKDIIEEGTAKGQLPPNIKDVFVRELLSNHECICGRPLDDNTDSRKHVEELLERIVPNSFANDAVQGKFVINRIINNLNFTSQYIKYRKKITELTSQIDILNDDITAISDKLSSYDLEEIKQKENRRRELRTKSNQLSTRMGTIGNKLLDLQKKLDQYQEFYDKQAKTDKQLADLNTLDAFVDSVYDDVFDIRESIVDEVRIQLESKTREFFFKMIWKKDAFKDVRIIDEGSTYRISVLSENGLETLGDLSSGERQVLALSFTAALYSVSGFSAPVFIDTPFGRISSEARENIAKYLPEYLSDTQVVILPTDTEYTPEMRKLFLPKVGCEYKIEYNEQNKISKVVNYG